MCTEEGGQARARDNSLLAVPPSTISAPVYHTAAFLMSTLSIFGSQLRPNQKTFLHPRCRTYSKALLSLPMVAEASETVKC